MSLLRVIRASEVMPDLYNALVTIEIPKLLAMTTLHGMAIIRGTYYLQIERRALYKLPRHSHCPLHIRAYDAS